MCCFIAPPPPRHCCHPCFTPYTFGGGFPFFGFGPSVWGGHCPRDSFAFGAGVGLAFGATAIVGNLINRWC